MLAKSVAVLFAALTGVAAFGCSSERAPDAKPAVASGDKALLGAVPILAVRDLGETLRFYEEVLGFTGAWRWEDGDEYGGIGRGNVWLMFDRQPEVKVEGHLVWISAVGVDALYREHRAAGASIVLELADQPWGFREYRVRDNNGYHLRIAEPLPCHDHGKCMKIAR